MISRIAAWYGRCLDVLTPAARAAWNTALQTAAATFGLTLLTWIGQVREWADQHGAVAFPSPSVLGYALVSAVAGAAAGFVAWAVRTWQSKTGRGRPPAYPRG